MALLNENRNRIPNVVFEAVTGDFDSIRGQMRMITTDGDAKVKVCTTADTSGDFASLVTTLGGDIRYEAVTAGVAGNAITIEHADAGAGGPTALSIVVAGSVITVNLELDGLSANISTAGQVADAINADVNASALVKATAIGNLTITVAAEGPTNLAGALANGRKAALTAPGTEAIDYLSVVDAISGLPGPTVAHVETGAALVVTVTGNDFQKNVVVSGTFATDTAGEIAAAVNAHAEAKTLVVATAAVDGTGVNAALTETVLAKALSNSVWGTLTVA